MKSRLKRSLQKQMLLLRGTPARYTLGEAHLSKDNSSLILHQVPMASLEEIKITAPSHSIHTKISLKNIH